MKSTSLKKLSLKIFGHFFIVCLCLGWPVVCQAEVGPGAERLPDTQTFVYTVKYLGFPIGTVRTSVKGRDKINGRDVYVLEAIVETNNLVSKLRRVNSHFVSYLDAEELYTVRQEVHRREGSLKQDAVIEFDQVHHKACVRNLADQSQKTFDIGKGASDILSACYSLMLRPFDVGDRVEYNIFHNETNRSFFAFVRSKVFFRAQALGRGAREAFLIWPYAFMKGKKLDRGRVKAYFSCSIPRIPLLAIVKSSLLSVATVHLVKIER